MKKDPARIFIFDKLSEYPNSKSIFIKKILKFYLENKNFSYIDINKAITEQLKYERKVTKASEKIFENLRMSFDYELIFSLLNLLIVIFAMALINLKDFTKYQYFLIVIILCCISLFDAFNHLFFFDLNDWDSLWKTVVDTLLNVLIIALSTALSIQQNPSHALVKIWAFACLLKLYRFFLLYFKFDRQKLKAHVLYPFFRQLYDIAFQVFILFIVFASLGVNVFGGNINSYSLDVYNESMGTDYEYEILNFNTILNSGLTFFIIMLNNNWPIIANLSVIVNSQNKRLMKFMFIFFKFLVNYVFINSLIAFIIQIFNEYENRQRLNMIKRLSDLKGDQNKAADIKDEDYSDVFDDDLSIIDNR